MGQLSGVLHALPGVTTAAPRRFYQPELDGLRFYAFLGVFVCHTLPYEEAFYRGLHMPLPWLWGAISKSGAAGVDLFFALSAFLITSILLRERQQTGGISLRRFYLRRVLRIWPLYFFLVALGAVLGHTMAHQSLPWYYIAGYLLFVGNWVHAVFGQPTSICSPLWTVSIEEQFYLIWPVLMKLVGRRGMIIAGFVTLLLATVSRVGFMLAGWSGGFIYYGSTSRSDSLALGILLALFLDRLPRPARATRWLLLSGGLTGWIVSSRWLNEQPGPVDMRMVLGRLMVSLAAGAILYAGLDSRSRLLRGDWVLRLGKVSYGLYMLHLTVILVLVSLLHPVWGWQLLATKLLAFCMTVVVALASYRWLESPFLRMKDRFATVLSRPV
jgi:peptidoglycan/LPS O-acetylase OafA/YrhL